MWFYLNRSHPHPLAVLTLGLLLEKPTAVGRGANQHLLYSEISRGHFFWPTPKYTKTQKSNT